MRNQTLTRPVRKCLPLEARALRMPSSLADVGRLPFSTQHYYCYSPDRYMDAPSLKSFRSLPVLIFCCAILLAAQSAPARDEKSIEGFRQAMIALAPGVDPAEAESISFTSHTTARRLAREYRVVGPSVFQNFLIHIGVRQRGYCFHWAFDIGARLRELKLRTLELHWGAAYPNTRLEHNCIVVTARGQAFRDGYIIDGWRSAGRLLWWPVKKDNSYEWSEDPRLTAWLQNQPPASVAQSSAGSSPAAGNPRRLSRR